MKYPIRSILVPAMMILISGCGVFNKSGGEVLFEATEVGTPVGDKVTRTIGPEGGTLSSPDGRMTLTIPPDTVKTGTAFSIQPITNKTANGRGNGYRLEPDGAAFTKPVTLTLAYTDADIDGTVPEALMPAFQTKQGQWQARRSVRLNKEAKTIAFDTDHFTDYAFLSRLSLTPLKATLKPGGRQIVQIVHCEEPGFWDRIRSRPGNCTYPENNFGAFTLRGPGQIDDAGDGAVAYTAPGRKPSPNVAWITYTTYLFVTGGDDTQSQTQTKIELNAQITIVDQGYKATGSWGGMQWSGTVCDLQQPFNIMGQTPYLTFVFNFSPNENGSSGSVGVSGGGYGVTLHDGNGRYTVKGQDTEQPTIELTMESFKGSYPGAGTAKGSGTRYISLVPLGTDECSGK